MMACKPHVFLIVATSVDGLIAQTKGQASTDWTSQADKKFFAKKTKQAGVVVMGENTFATLAPAYRPLSDRLNVIYTRLTQADFCQKYSLDQSSFVQKQVQLTSQAPQVLIKQLADQGFDQVAVCGGTTIYTMFMQEGVVDQVCLTVEPVLFGQGLSLFKQGFKPIKQLELKKIDQLNDQGTLLLVYENK